MPPNANPSQPNQAPPPQPHVPPIVGPQPIAQLVANNMAVYQALQSPLRRCQVMLTIIFKSMTPSVSEKRRSVFVTYHTFVEIALDAQQVCILNYRRHKYHNCRTVLTN